MKPRWLASSQTGRRGHEVRHASRTSAYGRGPGPIHSRRSRINGSIGSDMEVSYGVARAYQFSERVRGAMVELRSSSRQRQHRGLLHTLEREARLHVDHVRLLEQLAHEKAREVIQILDLHAQQVVRLSSHRIALGDLGPRVHCASEFF